MKVIVFRGQSARRFFSFGIKSDIAKIRGDVKRVVCTTLGGAYVYIRLDLYLLFKSFLPAGQEVVDLLLVLRDDFGGGGEKQLPVALRDHHEPGRDLGDALLHVLR